MTSASRSVRRLEVALWIVGFCLLAAALGATFQRRQYQAQQTRALFETAATYRGSDARAGAEVAPVSTPVNGAAFVGPRQPALLPVMPADRSGVSRVSLPSPQAPAAAKQKREAVVSPHGMGLIEIPRLGLRAVVDEGDDDETLARAVGLVPGGARPGEAGNIILAGHRDTFFWPLRKIKVDDRIRIVVPPHEYEYRVDSLRVVPPEQTDVLASRGVEELTLVTCHPFRFIGPAPDRFIVSASRVR